MMNVVNNIENPAIKTENLIFDYGTGTPQVTRALNNVSLSINRGEFVGIIGHTGSGKSTLVQHFNGLVKPLSGRVSVMGQDIWLNPKKIRGVRFLAGLVFQYPEYQLFEQTVAADIAYGPRNMGLSQSEIDERVNSAMKAVGLGPEFRDKSPFSLSGGEKRRVAIAGVVAMRPPILILDEPAAGLDPLGREKIFSLIDSYHKESRATVIIISHSMDDVAGLCGRVIVMNKGGVFLDGTPSEVFTKAKELRSVGLSPPAPASLMAKLRERGMDVPADVYTVNGAIEALSDFLGLCVENR